MTRTELSQALVNQINLDGILTESNWEDIESILDEDIGDTMISLLNDGVMEWGRNNIDKPYIFVLVSDTSSCKTPHFMVWSEEDNLFKLYSNKTDKLDIGIYTNEYPVIPKGYTLLNKYPISDYNVVLDVETNKYILVSRIVDVLEKEEEKSIVSALTGHMGSFGYDGI